MNQYILDTNWRPNVSLYTSLYAQWAAINSTALKSISKLTSTVSKKNISIIGDGLETDIAGGNAIGINTILITNGILSKELKTEDKKAKDQKVESKTVETKKPKKKEPKKKEPEQPKIDENKIIAESDFQDKSI